MTIDIESKVPIIDARGIRYRELNAMIRDCVSGGSRQIELRNVCGQRYIGTSLNKPVEINITGIPGNDLGAFMDGPRITVRGNAQDGCGNTMNEGEIIIHGHAGDIVGLSARGGKIFVRDDVGYRAGIHMKQYQDKRPVLVVGGTAQDFPGEYMAGGILILLGLNLGEAESHRANFVGTGMHGGVIYLRGHIDDFRLGKEIGMAELNDSDYRVLETYIGEFAGYFGYNTGDILNHKFTRLSPLWLRPYGRIYTY